MYVLVVHGHYCLKTMHIITSQADYKNLIIYNICNVITAL